MSRPPCTEVRLYGVRPADAYLDPDNFLFGPYSPGNPRNISPSTTRRGGQLIASPHPERAEAPRARFELQRYLANRSTTPDALVRLRGGLGGALKNYGPNLGYDYGGRLLQAWLDR